MTHWKLKSMIAATALLGLVGPAVAMKTAGGGQLTTKKPPQQQQQRNAPRSTPAASHDDRLGSLQRSESAPLDDKKAPGEAKLGQKQGEVTEGAEATQQQHPPRTTAAASAATRRTPLIEAVQRDGEAKKAESVTAEQDKSDQKSESSEAGKEYQLPDFSDLRAKKAAQKGKGGGGPGPAAASAASREPTSVAVKAPTLAIAKKKNLGVAGGKESFDAMVAGLDEDSLSRGEHRGGTDGQLRLDIQNIAQNLGHAKFINFQIQVNGGKLPNKDHTSLANVILDKRLLKDSSMALQKLKEGLAQSFEDGTKVIVTFNDAEGAAFIREHDPTKKSSESDEEEDKKGKKDKKGKS